MSCSVHALCEECYAGFVDVGKATHQPQRVPTRPASRCCQCGAEGCTLFLSLGVSLQEKGCHNGISRLLEEHEASEFNATEKDIHTSPGNASHIRVRSFE